MERSTGGAVGVVIAAPGSTQSFCCYCCCWCYCCCCNLRQWKIFYYNLGKPQKVLLSFVIIKVPLTYSVHCDLQFNKKKIRDIYIKEAERKRKGKDEEKGERREGKERKGKMKKEEKERNPSPFPCSPSLLPLPLILKALGVEYESLYTPGLKHDKLQNIKKLVKDCSFHFPEHSTRTTLSGRLIMDELKLFGPLKTLINIEVGWRLDFTICAKHKKINFGPFSKNCSYSLIYI